MRAPGAGLITALLALSACGGDARNGADAPGAPERTAAAALRQAGAGGSGAARPPPTDFTRAAGTREWRFPRDHGAHPSFETEWWYVTGIVRDRAGLRFGYQVTFFRVGLPGAPPPVSGRVAGPGLREARAGRESERPPRPAGPRSPWRARDLIVAHVAVTDVRRGRLAFGERSDRAALGFAAADTADLDVRVGTWRLHRDDAGFVVRVPADSSGGIALDLVLRSRRQPVLHGEGGLAAKGAGSDAGASWYVSLPRLETDGVLRVSGTGHRVSGTSWMDHEFFTGGLAREQEGWDWFSLRLEDGRDVLLYRLRRIGGGTDFALGTATNGDGGAARPLDLDRAVFERIERWRSPGTGADYPVAWRITLPGEDLRLEVRTPVPAQEIPSRGSVGFAYWEGLVDASGSWDGEPVRAEGYLEMTGYDRPLRLP